MLRKIGHFILYFTLFFVALCFWSLFSHQMPWQSPPKKTEHQLTILTYNTHGMLVHDRIETKNTMLNYINSLDADVVCFQEVLVYKNQQLFTLSDLRKAMKKYPYSYYDFKVYNHKRQFGNVVFSRYPLINKQTIRYESQANISSQCDMVVKNDTIRLIINHLESFHLEPTDFNIDSLTNKNINQTSLFRKIKHTSRLRHKQVWKVRKSIYHSPYPVIAVGDFNSLPISTVYWTMNLGLRDCFAESSFGRYGTTYRRKGIGVRIDYIFASRELYPLACRVEQVTYSDHFPVIATIGW